MRSHLAPRGIVAAAVASITAATLESQGIEGGQELKALVFLVIASTVIVSGVAARPVSAMLSVRLPRRDHVAILGALGLALALAAQLREAEIPVTFFESDPKRSRTAEEAGHTVVFGDPLEERTMLRARPELVGIAVGLTFNEHLNTLFARQAVDGFSVPRGLIATESLFGEEPPSLLSNESTDVLFDGPHDHERWDVRCRHGQVTVEQFTYQAEGNSTHDGLPRVVEEKENQTRELYVILSVKSGARIFPMHQGHKFRPGDVAAVALHTAERQESISVLRSQGWVKTERHTGN